MISWRLTYTEELFLQAGGDWGFIILSDAMALQSKDLPVSDSSERASASQQYHITDQANHSQWALGYHQTISNPYL